MKRTTPLRRSALARSRPVKARMDVRVADINRELWKRPRWGRCKNCGLIDDRPLHGHHVVARQIVVRAGGGEWDPRNRMDLCESCHMNHEFGLANRKLLLGKVPERALVFAVDVLGEHGAADYLRRHYA